MSKKMLTLLEINKDAYQAQVTKIKIDSFGNLSEISVSFYGYDEVDDEQYLYTTISINSKSEVSGPEFIPTYLIAAVVSLYKEVDAVISHRLELTTRCVPSVAIGPEPSDRRN